MNWSASLGLLRSLLGDVPAWRVRQRRGRRGHGGAGGSTRMAALGQNPRAPFGQARLPA